MWLLLSLAHAEECLPARAWIDRAGIDVLTGDTAVINASLEQARASMRCAPPTPEELADWWLYTGASRHFAKDPEAIHAFAAARRIAPDRFDPRLGTQLRALWEVAADIGTGQFVLDTNHDRAWVDTAHVDAWPATVTAGEHYVEVRDHGGKAVWNTMVRFDADSTTELTTGLPELPKVATAPKRRAGTPWLVASLASAAAAGGAFAAAWVVSDDVRTAPDPTTLERSNTTMHTLAWGGVGLGGAAAVLLGVSVVVK